MTARARTLLGELIAFDTTSRNSNLDFIHHVETYLADLDIKSTRIASRDGRKANLYASIGPNVPGGVILSGHTDVVPVDGQPWTSDPFTMTARGDRLFGRGTCDMKGFLALMLAAAPAFAKGRFTHPVHFAFSYDEEIGCLGAPDMIAEMAKHLPAPRCAIIGEPTSMRVVTGHKGVYSYRVEITGREWHSSAPDRGASAIMAALPLLGDLAALATHLESRPDPAFDPPHATLTVGMIEGGTAANILARKCGFTFDFRAPPGIDPDAELAHFAETVAALDTRLKSRFSGAGATFTRLSSAPPCRLESADAADFVRRLAGDNGQPRTVAYGTEAGQFQQAGFPVVICGPGSIDQAHQPDEYLDIAQLERGATFMTRLMEALS
ncbi:acetylornithine deacetylase [Pacificimonas sp. WHA3]|uniref:Acetylornithine deacetylase n=1 Tax=Pacificimonas pallii TaxID=2827236 RepID=A0ABS6SC80_9SPHN|nr:acetylornithine deacetylase [Pacificimonas pallii]MBV7256029.1 acetylornithine deacetylase [Pacificimonas pallii]